MKTFRLARASAWPMKSSSTCGRSARSKAFASSGRGSARRVGSAPVIASSLRRQQFECRADQGGGILRGSVGGSLGDGGGGLARRIAEIGQRRKRIGPRGRRTVGRGRRTGRRRGILQHVVAGQGR